ncbi:MAG: restriction endonuclease [Nitrospiraceae bacterium]|nr:MAG: restriction endonuclease [Nitrospiraceae bacterium]
MGAEWRRVRLGEVVDINPDVIGPDWPYAHIRYVDISSVGEGVIVEPPKLIYLEEAPSRAKRLVREGDTVLSTVRPGRRSMFFVSAPEPDLVVSTGFAVLRPKAGILDPRYLYACVFDKAFTDYLVSREKGAAYPAVLPEDLADATVNLPPLPDQRAMAHILGTLDDKIELNRRMSETLEQMARALFKAWFVDFEPVRAKMEGRWRRGESLPGLPAHLYDLFPDRLVPSELGEIPEGWEVDTVGKHVRSVKGKSYKSEHLQEGGDTALVTLKSFARGGGYRHDGLKSYSGAFEPEQVVRPGELVIACTDVTQAAEVIGRPALVQSSERYRTLVASLDVLIVRPRSEAVSVPFLYCLFRTEQFAEHTYAHSTGTTVLHLSKDAVPSYQFVRPPARVMQMFTSIAQGIFERIDEAEGESRTLAALRDALLPKLISGELRVKDAEWFLKESGL